MTVFECGIYCFLLLYCFSIHRLRCSFLTPRNNFRKMRCSLKLPVNKLYQQPFYLNVADSSTLITILFSHTVSSSLQPKSHPKEKFQGGLSGKSILGLLPGCVPRCVFLPIRRIANIFPVLVAKFLFSLHFVVVVAFILLSYDIYLNFSLFRTYENKFNFQKMPKLNIMQK